MIRSDDKFTVFQRIRYAVLIEKTLSEPFSAKDIRRFARGWTYTCYHSFLAYNCSDKLPEDEALFVRVERGATVFYEAGARDKVDASEK